MEVLAELESACHGGNREAVTPLWKGHVMNSAGARPDPEAAAAALRNSRAAQAAARRPRALPIRYAVAQGLLCAGGFTALGVSMADPEREGLLVAIALGCLVGLLGVSWSGMHHGGVAPWFVPRGTRPSWLSWGLPALPFVVGLLALIPYGMTGGLIGFGVATGLVTCVQGAWNQVRARETS
ncbi:hypothetical protein ACIQCD_10420 [Streptomyces sp. NPDC093250]|uniref:hypothetical protein n=1 Tax=Streptomyces sp. NPDC093250 TaxID=3366036 RepID=UPI0038028B1F